MVGAGPVGLTMACELARNGVGCRLLDRSSGPATESRALAIHARTLEIFDDMDVVDRILALGHRLHGASIFAEGHRILQFSFDELASPYPFVLTLPQSETERVLRSQLHRLGVEVEQNMNVTGIDQDTSGVTLYVQGQSLPAEYVIGCDGAHSTTRHAAGMPFEGDSTEEHFLLADVALDWDGADDEMYLWFHEDGLFALFPMPGGMYRIIAETGSGTAADPELLRTVVRDRGPKNCRMGAPQWMSSFKITHRKATEYQRGRIFVAGDAAHVQSPAGGQGMNTGIQDAYNLAWKLGMVMRGNAPESLLESYTAEREPVARSVLALTSNITTVATLRHPISQAIRNRLMPILAGFEILEQRLMNRLAEISINYRESLIVGQSGRWYGPSPMPGDRAVDAPLSDGRRLFQILKGTRHVLLLFGAERQEEDDLPNFENIDRYMRDGYGAEIRTYLVDRKALPWEGSRLEDHEGNVHHAYGAGVPCLYLIRPDGYIAFRSLSTDPLPVLQYLNEVYEPA